jgi:hypothetical protein
MNLERKDSDDGQVSNKLNRKPGYQPLWRFHRRHILTRRDKSHKTRMATRVHQPLPRVEDFRFFRVERIVSSVSHSLRVPLLCWCGDPWWFFVQAIAEIECGFIDWFLSRPGPEVKMVARRSALETTEHVTAKVSRKGAVFSSLGWLMEWAFAHLAADRRHRLHHRYHGDVLVIVIAANSAILRNLDADPLRT